MPGHGIGSPVCQSCQGVYDSLKADLAEAEAGEHAAQQNGLDWLKQRDALAARVAVLEAALNPMVGHDDPSIHHAACAALGINPAD